VNLFLRVQPTAAVKQKVFDFQQISKVKQIYHFLLIAYTKTNMATKKYNTSQIVKLDDDNYSRWRLQITLALKAMELWTIVDGTRARPAIDPDQQATWDKLDIDAQAILVPTLSPNQTTHVYNCTTSKEIFDKLKSINADSSLINKQLTLSQFLTYKTVKNQSLIQVYTELAHLGRALNEMGVVMGDDTIITKIVSCLPDDEFQAFKKSWDSTSTPTMPALLARLKKEELERTQKSQDTPKHDSSKAFTANVSKPEGNSSSKIQELKKKTKCHNCKKVGHLESAVVRNLLEKIDPNSKTSEINSRTSHRSPMKPV